MFTLRRTAKVVRFRVLVPTLLALRTSARSFLFCSAVHLKLDIGFARFDLAVNQYGACLNYGFGFGAGYDGAVCTPRSPRITTQWPPVCRALTGGFNPERQGGPWAPCANQNPA